MISFEMRPIEKTLAKVESGFFKLIGIDEAKQMTWKEYFFAMFTINLVAMAFATIIGNTLTLQNHFSFLSS
jgi:potassium-transporting ATPase potassium-binding subunit